MDINLYNEIIVEIQNHKGLSKDCNENLLQKYSKIHPGTIASIVSQEYQKRMKQSNYKNTAALDDLYNKYTELKKGTSTPGILVDLAVELGVAPSIAARIILKQYYAEELEEDENAVKSSKKNINSILKDTTQIEDNHLAYEVFLCTLLDDQYSPIAETIKHTVGQQYEIRLQRYLQEAKVMYRDENSLRKNGFDKTPDIKLDVPIAVNGFVINWIESKALFGDEETHKGYVKDQYLCYWNRFGAGLVIYWFGYLETIKDPAEKRFMIMENVPKQEDLIYFDPSLVTKYVI